MKAYPLIIIALLTAVACQAQPAPVPPPPGAPPAVVAREPVNYLIRVEWRVQKGDPQFLEVLTAEGSFSLDTVQKTSVKINNNDIPTTLKFSGTLAALDDEKGRLQLFLGRAVPYVTGTYGTGLGAQSSYQQLSVGLNSTFTVTFGKSVIIQNDENGSISVLVKRMKN
jgi:hypothetical protein